MVADNVTAANVGIDSFRGQMLSSASDFVHNISVFGVMSLSLGLILDFWFYILCFHFCSKGLRYGGKWRSNRSYMCVFKLAQEYQSDITMFVNLLFVVSEVSHEG